MPRSDSLLWCSSTLTRVPTLALSGLTPRLLPLVPLGRQASTPQEDAVAPRAAVRVHLSFPLPGVRPYLYTPLGALPYPAIPSSARSVRRRVLRWWPHTTGRFCGHGPTPFPHGMANKCVPRERQGA